MIIFVANIMSPQRPREVLHHVRPSRASDFLEIGKPSNFWFSENISLDKSN